MSAEDAVHVEVRVVLLHQFLPMLTDPSVPQMQVQQEVLPPLPPLLLPLPPPLVLRSLASRGWLQPDKRLVRLLMGTTAVAVAE
jgi:hypothetical protein